MNEIFYCSNGIEEPLEESSHEPEPEPESETKTEELKPPVEEKNLEELEEKSASPPPAEPVSLPQEPPKVRSEELFRPVMSRFHTVPFMKHDLCSAMLIVE